MRVLQHFQDNRRCSFLISAALLVALCLCQLTASAQSSTASMSSEERRLKRMDPMDLAKRTIKGKTFEPISRRLGGEESSGPPSEITIVNMALPASSTFVDEAVLMEAVMEEINSDPTLFPNTTVKGLVMSEGTTITSMLATVEYAFLAGACVTTGVATGSRQALMGSISAVRNTNHAFWMDMELGTLPRYSEFATSFGIMGWANIISSLLDMLEILDPVINRFALILPESYAPLGDRFLAEQELRGISVVYKMIFDYSRVDDDATFDDADAYAAQIIDGVVASKANIVFQCFCSMNNKYFRSQLMRRAVDSGLMVEGFQWFTHMPGVVDYMESWIYKDEFRDLWPHLDHFKVIDQPDYEPSSYDYVGSSYKHDQDPALSDDILASKIQKHIEVYNVSAPDRGLKSLSWLDCSSSTYADLTVCDPTVTPSLDSHRALKFDAIKQIAKTLHEIIVVDGYHDFCDLNYYGLRVGEADLFLEKLKSLPLSGFSGHREFKPTAVSGGEVLTLSASFMLNDWTLSSAAGNGGYEVTREPIMHINRWASEDANIGEKVMKRNFFTGAEVQEITWMAGTKTSPKTWYHDMCGKGYRIDMDRVDKKCIACDTGEFNAPLDNEDKCESIADYYCAPGTYMVYALATGAGLTRPCMTCSAGTFSLGGTQSCSACPLGTFAASEGVSECTSCAAALNTSDALTTRQVGATSSIECVCPESTYRKNGACLPCPEGMTCKVGSDFSNPGSLPIPLPGFMSLVEAPLQVYKCSVESGCPGGGAGVCAPNRDSTAVACARCEQGFFEDDGVCRECDGGHSYLPFAFAGLVCVTGLAALTISINRSALLQTDASMLFTVIVGVTITSLQFLNLYLQMELHWLEPVKSTFQTLAILSFDTKALRGSCVLGPGAEESFVFKQLLGPLCAPIVWLTLIIQKRLFPENTDTSVMFANTIGVICQGLFIAMTLSAVSPMVCYLHPGDSGSSMVASPEILCDFQGLHLRQVLIGLAALCAIPLPFVAATAYAIGRYPCVVQNSANYRWMQSFRFVFFKFRPRRYYFNVVLLTRSLLVCMVPVVIRQDTPLQVCIVAAILGAWIVAQQQLLPWKGKGSNLLDGIMTMSLLLLLLCGTISSPATETNSVAVIGTVLFVIFGICLGAAVSVAVSSKVSRRPIGLYICYNRSEVEAQVQFLRLLFVQQTHRRVFPESDSDQDLGVRIDIVKTQAKHFLIFLTTRTLESTPCIAAVAAAYAAAVPTFAISPANFELPPKFDLSRVEECLHLNGRLLNEHFITIKDIQHGLHHILSHAVVHIKIDAVGGTRQLMRPANKLLHCSYLRWNESMGECAKPEIAHQDLLTWLPPRADAIPVCCDSSDPEAVASAGIICFTLMEFPVFCLADEPLSHEEKVHTIETARSVVIVLSHGSLMCFEQLESIMLAIFLRGKEQLLPVTLPSFEAPVEKYYRVLLPALFATADSEVFVDAFRDFLKISAVAFSPSSSEGASALLKARITTTSVSHAKPSPKSSTASTDTEACRMGGEITRGSMDSALEDASVMLSMLV